MWAIRWSSIYHFSFGSRLDKGYNRAQRISDQQYILWIMWQEYIIRNYQDEPDKDVKRVTAFLKIDSILNLITSNNYFVFYNGVLSAWSNMEEDKK